MKLVIKDGILFRKIINCLKDLITETTDVIFTSEGMSLLTIDTAKNVLISSKLGIDAFETYDNHEEETRLTISLVSLNEILKMSKSQRITIEKQDQSLLIELGENNKKVSARIALMESEGNEYPFHRIDYDIVAYVDCAEFQKSIKDLGFFGEKCQLTFEDNDLVLSVEGPKGIGKISICDIEIESDMEPESIPSFLLNMKYLNIFSKAAIDHEVVLKLKKGVPFCFEYRMECGTVQFYLSELDE